MRWWIYFNYGKLRFNFDCLGMHSLWKETRSRSTPFFHSKKQQKINKTELFSGSTPPEKGEPALWASCVQDMSSADLVRSASSFRCQNGSVELVDLPKTPGKNTESSLNDGLYGGKIEFKKEQDIKQIIKQIPYLPSLFLTSLPEQILDSPRQLVWRWNWELRWFSWLVCAGKQREHGELLTHMEPIWANKSSISMIVSFGRECV